MTSVRSEREREGDRGREEKGEGVRSDRAIDRVTATQVEKMEKRRRKRERDDRKEVSGKKKRHGEEEMIKE